MTSGYQHHQRRYFLTDIPLEEAANRFFGALEEAGSLLPMPQESLPLAQAQGRVTARPIWAEASSPHYDAAAMDGVAVRAVDTAGGPPRPPTSPCNWTHRRCGWTPETPSVRLRRGGDDRTPPAHW